MLGGIENNKDGALLEFFYSSSVSGRDGNDMYLQFSVAVGPVLLTQQIGVIANADPPNLLSPAEFDARHL